MKPKRSEAWVKAQVKKVLKELGVWYFMPQAGPYGVSGIPDFICCKNGQFIGIETKAGYNKPTELQLMRMEEIQRARGVTMVVNEDNLAEAREWLESV